jgi:hypothetical protein
MLVSRAQTQIVVRKYPTTEAWELVYYLVARIECIASDLGISLVKQGRWRFVSIVVSPKLAPKAGRYFSKSCDFPEIRV